MSVLPNARQSLWGLTTRGLTTSGRVSPHRFVAGASHRFLLGDLVRTGSFADPEAKFHGRSVLIACETQERVVSALLQIDGLARRMMLCPPDLLNSDLSGFAAEAEVDVVVTEGSRPPSLPSHIGHEALQDGMTAPPAELVRDRLTEWLLFTSGTNGRPKMVVHTLATLVAPIDDGMKVPDETVWSTFYDIRRYGGLQILLRSMIGGGSIVLSQAGEPTRNFLARAGEGRVTHISGTPSHWRSALMSGATSRMSPNYVRLSGEVADQGVLDRLKRAFPDAQIAHAFASTEAGVAFDVRDGLAGFPATLIGCANAPVDMRITDGSLWIQSARMASRYLGGALLANSDGYVDTGDMVELRDGRYYFAGRRDGAISVGGQKVYPEEIESVLNRHQAVSMSRAYSRFNTILGSSIVADIVLRNADDGQPPINPDEVEPELVALCRDSSFRYVADLTISPAGKVSRAHA
jgi:acyl-CoA synthetase (AMP-forming)/AMP-acid ligase II